MRYMVCRYLAMTRSYDEEGGAHGGSRATCRADGARLRGGGRLLPRLARAPAARGLGVAAGARDAPRRRAGDARAPRGRARGGGGRDRGGTPRRRAGAARARGGRL